ncbi:MAG: hypothetical protein WB511_01255 [Nitrososphaeraceae archaeon]
MKYKESRSSKLLFNLDNQISGMLGPLLPHREKNGHKMKKIDFDFKYFAECRSYGEVIVSNMRFGFSSRP